MLNDVKYHIRASHDLMREAGWLWVWSQRLGSRSGEKAGPLHALGKDSQREATHPMRHKIDILVGPWKDMKRTLKETLLLRGNSFSLQRGDVELEMLINMSTLAHLCGRSVCVCVSVCLFSWTP